jgi:DNA-binding transcriptional LysR family regulator
VATPPQPCQLADTPLVLHEPGSGTRATLEMAITVAGWAVCESVLELAATAAARNAVVAGVAPTVIRALVIAKMSLRGRLRIVDVT